MEYQVIALSNQVMLFRLIVAPLLMVGMAMQQSPSLLAMLIR
jgi:hypothetical protein